MVLLFFVFFHDLESMDCSIFPSQQLLAKRKQRNNELISSILKIYIWCSLCLFPLVPPCNELTNCSRFPSQHWLARRKQRNDESIVSIHISWCFHAFRSVDLFLFREFPSWLAWSASCMSRSHWGQGGIGGSSYFFSLALVDLPRRLAYVVSEIPLKVRAWQTSPARTEDRRQGCRYPSSRYSSLDRSLSC